MEENVKTTRGRIYCDQNDLMTARGYRPTSGTIKDLAALGLTIESAVGQRFELAMPDADGDIVGIGSVIIDPEHGFLLEVDENGFEWVPRTVIVDTGSLHGPDQ